MAETTAMPSVELKRISQANRTVLEVAESLLQMAAQSHDSVQRKTLEGAVSRLISSSNAVSGAVQSTFIPST